MIYLLPFFVVFFLFLVITPGKPLNKGYMWIVETFIPKAQEKFSKTKVGVRKNRKGKNENYNIETNVFCIFLGLVLKMLGCLFCICHWTTLFALIVIYATGICDFDLWFCVKNFVYTGTVSTFIFRALMNQR